MVRLKQPVNLLSLLVTARAHVVHHVALFFSRDAAINSHSRRLFELRNA